VLYEEPARNHPQETSLVAARVVGDVMLDGHCALLRQLVVRRQGRKSHVAFELSEERIECQSPFAGRHTEDTQPCWNL